MARTTLILLLLGLLATPLARAEGGYGGVLFAKLETEGSDTGNLGVQAGIREANGIGFEVFYAATVAKDSNSFSGFEFETSIDAYGLLGTYQTPGDTYVKFKAGIAMVAIEFDLEDASSEDDDESGFAYGIGVGTAIGKGQLELNYLVLPEFEEFQGTDVDADVDMLSLSYLWDF